MSIFLRGKIYWCSFQFEGKRIQESTGERTPKKAANYEEDRRSELRKEFNARQSKAEQLGCDPDDLRRCSECENLFFAIGIEPDAQQNFCGDDCNDKWKKKQSPVPRLTDFLKNHFLPYAETTHAKKASTLRYYKSGTASLTKSHLAELRLDRITNQQAAQYEARLKRLSPSTINCGLRTLRRAIYLAAEWGVLTARPKISLAKGERQRERVLTDMEVDKYLSACEQPWRDAAIVMLGTAMRPGEVFALRWERIHLNGSGGMLQVTEGKSKAAKRMLPMVPAVYQTLRARHVAQGKPVNGWTFPAGTKSGHLEGYCAKNQHAAALRSIEKAASDANVETPVKRFPPYTLRHTALTRLGESGCDAFTLAKIAGHSSITITQRYVHPQAEAIDLAFSHYKNNYTEGTPLLPSGGELSATVSAERR